jgi:hypothetical protein
MTVLTEKGKDMVGENRGIKWPGLTTINNAEGIRWFVEAVEAAFAALHQPSGTLDEALKGDKSKDGEPTPISQTRFVEWAHTVEDRMEYMGLAHISLGLPEKHQTEIEPAALVKWTKRVWARFAALGQVIDSPEGIPAPVVP